MSVETFLQCQILHVIPHTEAQTFNWWRDFNMIAKKVINHDLIVLQNMYL